MRGRPRELAGFAPEVDPDLVELDYGAYEGRTTAGDPGRAAGLDGLGREPGGETLAEAGARADRVIARALAADGDVALFAHGHILRVLGARWIELPPERGARLLLGTAAVCELGFERETRVIARWNT